MDASFSNPEPLGYILLSHDKTTWASNVQVHMQKVTQFRWSSVRFCGLAHELLTYDGLIVLRLETVKRFAKQGSAARIDDR